ncbi:DNA repair exonuclease [Bartonella sp. HY329]|uniref:metallophosphoesterase family protein n=1 Tax=unclassified Bartonella TaxID=2645622 RepID=UPI0021C9A218|nr:MULTISPECIES: DNA repair exonuclease [unclassified Bartonella]UXM96235.1 DNA repair exonuclease [Bartonella sp. HY329]UXN10559.1 DNA repair exonuclease [Bartonella sp. HY328]
MAFRFIHTADIHLDSPLRSLSLRDEELGNLIGNASRTVLSNIINLAIEERVNAVIIAGDLYDGSQTSMKTARFLSMELKRLDDANIACFIIRGNHDAASTITHELTLPQNVTVFKTRAGVETIKTDTLNIALHGISFKEKTAPDSLLPLYKAPLADHINIGLMHTSLDGQSGHDPYAPCSVKDLQNCDFNYWALGHIHKRQVIEDKTTKTTIVMPGIPQGRDINENGYKSVTLVTVADDGSISLDEKPISLAQFDPIAVDVSGIENFNTVVPKIEHAMLLAKEKALSQHLVARIELIGATPLNWRLINDSQLLEEAKLIGEKIGNMWIDKLLVRTTPAIAQNSTADPTSELALIMADIAKNRSDIRKFIKETATSLRNDPQLGLNSLMGDDEESFDSFIDQLINEGSRDIIARLKA